MPKSESTPKPRRVRRWIIRIAVLLVVVLLAAVAIGPWVASRLAPGIIESVAAGSIQGSVKVERVALGWTSPIEAGPIRLLDPQGQQVAVVEVQTPITLWKVVSGRWWSAKALELGTITVRGDADFVRKADGTTNLDAAIAPRSAAAPAGSGKPGAGGSGSGASGGAAIPDIKVRLQIAQLDATLQETGADGKLGPELGVQKLTGPIDVALDQGSLSAKADLTADVLSGNGSAGSKAVIKLDASAKQKTPGGVAGLAPQNIERATVSLDATGIPSALIDALGGFGGALEEGLGAASDAKVRIDGNVAAATIGLEFRSPGATADAALRLADGVLVAAESGKPAVVLNIKSTGFVAKLPQAASAIEQASESLTLGAGPSIDLKVESLRLPVPAGVTGGVPLDFSTIDLRSAGAKITLDVGAMAGEVAIPAPGADAASAKDRKPFSTESLRVVVDATDLAKPVTVSGVTKAMLEGRSAGEVVIDASADGLLDSSGRLRALQANAAPVGAVTANIAVRQLATALLQPFVAAMGLPIELAQDAGPTLDLTLNARTDAGATPATDATGLAALPPTVATVKLQSANLNADVSARLEKGELRSTGEGIRVTIASAAPLAQRVLAGDGTSPPAAMINGRVGIELTLTDVAASLDKLTSEEGSKAPLAAVDGKLNLFITDVRATLPPVAATDTQPAINAAPIDVQQTALSAVLARGQSPTMSLQAQATTTGAKAPMDIAANITADGLKTGALPTATGLEGLLALKLVGQISAKGVPPELLGALPQLAKYAPGASVQRGELDAAVAQAIGSTIGTGADATITLGQPQGGGIGQVVRVQLATQAQGAGSDLYMRLTPSEAAITGGTTFLVAEPTAINAILAAASAPAPDETQADAAPAAPGRPITLESRNKLWLRFPEPVLMPLRKTAEGAIEPDFAKAKDFFATLAAEGEIVIGGIPIGSELPDGAAADAQPVPTYTSARLGKLEAQARVPMAALVSEEAKKATANRATLKLTTDARSGEGGQIAAVSIDAKAGLDASSPEALVALANINTANVDKLLKRDGMVTGALGDKADITLRVAPIAGSAADLNLNAEITSPTISGASLSLAKRADSIALTGPSNITWTPAPAFLNSLLVKDDASVRVTKTSPVTVNLTKFAIATGPEGTGPLMPGVFELDAQITSPQLAMDIPAQPDTKGVRGPARALTMNGITMRARWDPSAPAIRQSAAGAMSIAMNIDSISGAEGPAAKPSKVTATLRALADAQGNLVTDKAVLDADADLSLFPTILLDQLTEQGGLMAELLGPTVSASATARNVSQAAAGPRGNLEATMNSERANVQIKGDLRRGQFIQSGPIQVKIVEIRSELMQALAGSLPVIASMEKKTSDEPGLIQASDLTIPLDKDLSKLNGTVSIDPGVARFTTQNMFGSLLKAAGGRESGSIGRKIEPFVVRFNKGVISYDRFRLPLGEFSIETRGTVDLVKRELNFVTYVPLFALTDEAMGPLNTGLGGKLGILDRNTLVPITTKGPMDKPSTGIDVGMFLEETGSNILQTPGKLLEGIGDLLNGGKKKKDEPTPESPK